MTQAGTDDVADRDATGRLAAVVAGVEPALTLRTVEDTDAAALLALIGAAYDEYACGPMDPDGFDADLAAPRTSALAAGRRWWVVVDADRVVASVAHGGVHVDPSGARTVELHRLYLAPAARGVGLATALLAGVAEEARRLGADRLEAWSDTRLVDAHRRYLTFGLQRTGRRRELGDPAGTIEDHFALDLAPGSPTTRV